MNEVEQRLREIEERANRATPGPWYAKATDDASFMNAMYVSTRPGPFEHDNRRGMDPTAPDHDASHVVAITLLQTPLLADVADAKWDENTEFIAHAREDVPWLLSLLREREEQARQLGVQMERYLDALVEIRDYAWDRGDLSPDAEHMLELADAALRGEQP